MPIYEYRCQNCGQQLEEIQKVNDVPLKECPHCGKPGLERIVSNTSFQLKGGGWYKTDYKKETKKPTDSPASTVEKSVTKDQPSTSASADKADKK